MMALLLRFFHVGMSLFVSDVFSWESAAGVGIKRFFTDNVNLTHENPASDTYYIFNGYGQLLNEDHRFRLRAKISDYSHYSSNDSRYLELSYKHKKNESVAYNISLFQEKYPHTSLIANDTSYDNSGGKLYANFSHKVSEEMIATVGPTIKFKNYSGAMKRKDRLLDCFVNLDYRINPKIIFTPELSFSLNNSSASYYDTMSINPSVSLAYDQSNNVQFYALYSILFSSYRNRIVSVTTNNRAQTMKEEQTLSVVELGGSYFFTNFFEFVAKYTIEENSSNNNLSSTSKEYSANSWMLGISASL